MEKLLWQLYERFYDLVLLSLIPYQRMLLKAYHKLAPVKGQHYLDAGCGTGNLMKLLHEKNPDIKLTGVDFSPAMLKCASNKLAKSDSEISFLELDLNRELPFVSQSFKGATCINVLYALKKPEHALKELNRVLVDNGRLIVITPLMNPGIVDIIKNMSLTWKKCILKNGNLFLAGPV